MTGAYRLDDLRDLTAAVARTRRLFDLDADPESVNATLGRDPVLAPFVAARPGLRVPGHPDGTELVTRAIVGQQVSVAGARTIVGRIAARIGKPLDAAVGSVTRRFPDAAAIAALTPEDLPMPRARGRALIATATAIADGHVVIDPGADRDELRGRLVALPGIGPWTAEYVLMRAVGDPDAFLPTDLGIRRALVACGLDAEPRAVLARAEAWRPWRAYANAHLWASLAPVIRRGDETVTKYRIYEGPEGPLLLAIDDAGRVVRLHFVAGRPPVEPGWERDDAALDPVVTQLDEYFAGTRHEFDLELAPEGTPFQLEVWAQLRADSRTARRSPTGSSPSGSTGPVPLARWVPPTARTRSRSSCRATASSAPTARSPGSGAGWRGSSGCSTSSSPRVG